VAQCSCDVRLKVAVMKVHRERRTGEERADEKRRVRSGTMCDTLYRDEVDEGEGWQPSPLKVVVGE
jgi:hypothetical protein